MRPDVILNSQYVQAMKDFLFSLSAIPHNEQGSECSLNSQQVNKKELFKSQVDPEYFVQGGELKFKIPIKRLKREKTRN